VTRGLCGKRRSATQRWRCSSRLAPAQTKRSGGGLLTTDPIQLSLAYWHCLQQQNGDAAEQSRVEHARVGEEKWGADRLRRGWHNIEGRGDSMATVLATRWRGSDDWSRGMGARPSGLLSY
jgi:hypothetical protein